MNSLRRLSHLVLFALLTSVTLSGCWSRIKELPWTELPGRILVGSLDGLFLLEPAELKPAECLGDEEIPVIIDGRASFPSWSPDSERFVFSRWGRPGSARYLVIYAGDTAHLQDSILPPDSLIYDFPSWSPDGSKIAFLGIDSASFTPEPEPLVGRVWGWFFAIFGRETFYDARVEPAWGRLFVMNVADRLPVQVTDVLSLPGRPSWSPDSKEIMFSTVDGKIVAVDLAGRITRELGRGIEPAWSRDGHKVAFYRRAAIYTQNIDGTGLKVVVRPERVWSRFWYCGPSWPYTEGGVAWSPDGQYLVYTGLDRFQRQMGTGASMVVVRLEDRACARFFYVLRSRGYSWAR